MRNLQKETVASAWGLLCPRCGKDHRLQIELTCWADLSVDGTDVHGDADWGEDSLCRCTACGHYGSVAAFQVPETLDGGAQ